MNGHRTHRIRRRAGQRRRYLLGTFVQRTLHIFPSGTFVVNVLGGLAVGWIAKALSYVVLSAVTRVAATALGMRLGR